MDQLSELTVQAHELEDVDPDIRQLGSVEHTEMNNFSVT